jgi:hypothetical protein
MSLREALDACTYIVLKMGVFYCMLAKLQHIALCFVSNKTFTYFHEDVKVFFKKKIQSRC